MLQERDSWPFPSKLLMAYVPTSGNLTSCRKLVNEIGVLDKMMSRSTFVKVLENVEDKLVIQESLKRIDGYTKDFQVRESRG